MVLDVLCKRSVGVAGSDASQREKRSCFRRKQLSSTIDEGRAAQGRLSCSGWVRVRELTEEQTAADELWCMMSYIMQR